MIELLVALSVAALLMVILGRAMSSVIANSEQLHGRLANSAAYVTLRRVLHRDIQGVDTMEKVKLSTGELTFTTRHTMVQDKPLLCTVSWLFSPDGVERREVIEELEYERTMHMLGALTNWNVEFYLSNEERWVGLDSWLISPGAAKERTKWVTAMRMTLQEEGGGPMAMTERFPHVLFTD